MFTYDEALKESLEYFNGDDLAAQVFLKKYALQTPDGFYLEKTPDDMHRRLAKEFARIEAKYKNPLSEDKIYGYLKNFKYIVPQGSPMAGVGNPYQIMSLSNCFVEGTKVHTRSGVKNIEDIKLGDEVLTHKGRYRRVVQLHKNKLNGRQVYAFKAYRTPEIKVTGNHEFMSISKEQLAWGKKPQFNPIQYLRVGDYIQVPNNVEKEETGQKTLDIFSMFKDGFKYGSFEYKAIEGSDDFTLVTLSKDGKLRPHNNPTPKSLTIDENFAYFLGLWYGGGCVFGENDNSTKSNKRNRKSKVCTKVRGLAFTFGSHETKLIDFTTQFLEKNKIKYCLNENPKNNTVQIAIHNSALGYAFEEYFGRRFDGKKLNTSIHSWNKSLVASMLQGLVDSDGTMTKQGDVRVVMSNRSFIEEVYHLARSFNFLVGFSTSGKVARLNFGRNDEIRNGSLKSYTDNRISTELSSKTNHFIEIDGVKFVQILSKKELSETPDYVYTFGVEEDHSYSVEGLIAKNCFVIESPYDSYGGILKTDQEEAQLMKRRGGVGFDISTIRPKGLLTANAAKTTDGIGVFMERYSNTCREVAQGGRRGALMLTISVHHPEIRTFVNIKRDLGKVTGANISVRLSDEFMLAVKEDKNVELRWPVDEKENPVVRGSVNARQLWHEIIESAHASAEPGLLFWDNVKNWSPADAYSKLGFGTVSTNPCFSGDTLIAVADGRNAVSIRELAEAGRDVPVYSVNAKTGVVEIKMGRNPRITGYNKKLVRVTLDDGSHFDVTPDHKCMLRDGTPILAKDLKKGDSLPRFIREKFKPSSTSKDYLRVKTDVRKNKYVSEHRLIAEFYQPEVWKTKYKEEQASGWIKGGLVVHHKDHNGLNNSPDNLEIMTFAEHQKYHAEHDTHGEQNGRYCGKTNEEIKAAALKLTKKLGRRFSNDEWVAFAKQNNLPQRFSSWHRTGLVSSPTALAKLCAAELGIEHISADPRLVKTLSSMLSQGYEAEIVGNQVLVQKTCETCQSKFSVEHNNREISFCSHSCSLAYVNFNQKIAEKRTLAHNAQVQRNEEKTRENQARIFSSLKFTLGREPTVKEWEGFCKKEKVPYQFGKVLRYGFKSWEELKEAGNNYNHKVVSVEELPGEHVVYNITVDDNHSVAVLTSKSDNIESGVFTSQCGEITLSPYDSCRLLLVNVVSFVKEPFTSKAELDWKLFAEVVQVAQRIMDDIVDLELECIDKILDKIEKDPEPDDVKALEKSLWNKIKQSAVNGRRTGLGVTAIGDALAALNVRYGSDESIKLMDEIYKNLAVNSYRSSVQMAKERGPFPVYDYELEKNHPFINRIMDQDPELRKEWEKWGRRNIANTTTAPAGSVSVLTQTTSGIEPAYLLSYTRRRKINPDDTTARVDFVDNIGDKWQEYDVYHHWFKKWMEVTGKSNPEESPYHGATSNDINWANKVRAQAAAQKWICHSISNTTNVPEDTTIETIKEIYMTGWETGCFLPGQNVYTAEGCKPIEQVSQGDLVVGNDGKLHKVKKTFKLKKEPRVVVSIKAKGLQGFTATADHPVAVLQCIGQYDAHKPWNKRQKQIVWLKADEISTNDYLLVPKIDNTQKNLSYIEMSSYLNLGKFVVERDRIYPVRKLPWKSDVLVKAANAKGVPNKINLTEDVLNFFGWFIAKGHFAKRSCVRMNFSLSEQDIAEKLANTIENTFKVSVRIFKTGGNGRQSLRLEFDSSIISQFLENLIGRGSRNKHLPPFYPQLSKIQLQVLLGGHYNGDKGVTVSKRLAEQLFHARLLLGETPFFKEKNGQGYYVDRTYGKGCCGREFNNYLAYKVHKTTISAYYDHVYNISIDDVDTYTINGAVVHNCKGVTVYRDKSRSGVLVSKSTTREDKKFLEHHAPKRPEILPCHIYHVQVKGEKWNFFVGLYEDKPYEIFAGRAKHIHLPKSRKEGIIKKNGTYNLYTGEGENELKIEDLATVFENPTESAFTRTVSLALRHGVPIQYLVEQIEKGADKENDMFSLAKGLMRILKRYIKDGTKPTAKKCPECNSSELAYQEGCLTCKSCGYSKCG